MLVGLTKWFDGDKGFGVIVTKDGKEYFLHRNNFIGNSFKIQKSFPIFFDEEIEKGKRTAKNARFFKDYEEFAELTSLFFTPDLDIIETKEKKRGRFGGYVHTKKFKISRSVLKCLLVVENENNQLTYFKSFVEEGTPNNSEKSIIDFFKMVLELRFIGENKKEIQKKLIDIFRTILSDDIFFEIWNCSRQEAKKLFYVDPYLIIQFEKELSIFSLAYLFSQDDVLLISQLIKRRIDQLKNHYQESKFKELQRLIKSNKKNIPLKSQELFSSYTLELSTSKINEFFNTVEIVSDSNTLNKCISQLRILGSEYFLLEKDLNRIRNHIIDLIISKCNDEYKIRFYLEGYSFPIDEEIIISQFEKANSHFKKSILIDCVKEKPLQDYLFLSTLSPEKINESYEFVLELFKSLNNGKKIEVNSKEEFLDDKNWENMEGLHLRSRFIKYYSEIDDLKLKCQYFLDKFLPDFPKDYVLNNTQEFSYNQLRQFFAGDKISKEYIFKTLQNKLFQYVNAVKKKEGKQREHHFESLIKFSGEFLEEKNKDSLLKLIKEQISNDVHVSLWVNNFIDEFPRNQILDIESIDSIFYRELIEKALLSDDKNKIIETLQQRIELQSNIEINDRATFYQAYLTFKSFLRLHNILIEKNDSESSKYGGNEIVDDLDKLILKSVNLDFIVSQSISESAQSVINYYTSNSFPLQKMFLFQLNLVESEFDFDYLKTKFIYFNPEDQVLIIKKLFKLKEKGSIDFSISQLNEIVRISHDIYALNEKLHPEVPLDLTSDLVISALVSFKDHGRFLMEGQLLEIVLRNLYGNKTQKFKIKDYFETCKGRTTSKINLHNTKGTIKKVPFGEGRFYFSIEFEYSETLVVIVKQLPGRKWNSEKKFWGVPSRYETEVLAFAKENRFLMDLGENNYECNPHLAVEKLEKIPNGITFCEGRISKKIDKQRQVPFYWCCNQSCYKLSETVHNFEDWKNYTFLDFCRILDFNVDEVNDYRTSPKGKYYQFVGLINRFNRLLDRLYCTECNHFLHPVTSSHFAHHRVVRFTCKNETCSSQEEVYLHHCLNGRCNSIIDSRVSKKCEHGLVICENCLSCCSHHMLSNRLSNLQKTGGYIKPQLIELVNGRLGHVERGIHFCYKCGLKMEKIGAEKYRCPNAHLEIDLSEFRMKRI